MSENAPIYRLVNGNRVRLSKPDSNRQYWFREESWIELSEEEEAKELKYQQSLKQWRHERLAQLRGALTYEHRIVAFLDVLGWKSAIHRSDHDDEVMRDLGMVLHALLEEKDRIGGLNFQRQRTAYRYALAVPSEVMVTQFSDSVVVSVGTADEEHAHRALVGALLGIVDRLLELGLVVRGGVAEGKVVHTDKLVFGPALNAAYDLEQTATFPRIILDHALASQLSDGYSLTDDFGQQVGIVRAWREAPDGKLFYNFLRPIVGDFGEVYTRKQVSMLRDIVVARLSESHPHAVTQKYEWLAEYLNCVVEEEALVDIEPIALAAGS